MSLRMSSLVLVVVATLSLARPAKADSLSILYFFNANSGSGDNATGIIFGPFTSIPTGGSTGCSWCFGTPLVPGATVNASIPYFDFGSFFTGVFQDTLIDSSNFSVGSTSLTAGSFTLPISVSGGTFTISVPASLEIIHIFNGTQTQAFGSMPGELKLTFLFNPQNQVYAFQKGTFVSVVTPEPQTLILFGSGLLGITAASFRKFREPRSQRV